MGRFKINSGSGSQEALKSANIQPEKELVYVEREVVREIPVYIEKSVEVRVEVPVIREIQVEVIREVEKLVEVRLPAERVEIIKEVQVQVEVIKEVPVEVRIPVITRVYKTPGWAKGLLALTVLELIVGIALFLIK